MKKMISILSMVIILCIMALTCPAAAQGNLFIDVTDSQDPVNAPTPYIYTINYAFDNQASGASIIDQLPFEVSFDSATGGGIYDSTTHSVLWDVSESFAGSVSVTVIPDHIPIPVCGFMKLKSVKMIQIQNTAVITMILPSGPESAIGDEFTTITGPVLTCDAPEFPSPILPAIAIIGFLGAVLLIQRNREH